MHPRAMRVRIRSVDEPCASFFDRRWKRVGFAAQGSIREIPSLGMLIPPHSTFDKKSMPINFSERGLRGLGAILYTNEVRKIFRLFYVDIQGDGGRGGAGRKAVGSEGEREKERSQFEAVG